MLFVLPTENYIFHFDKKLMLTFQKNSDKPQVKVKMAWLNNSGVSSKAISFDFLQKHHFPIISISN